MINLAERNQKISVDHPYWQLKFVSKNCALTNRYYRNYAAWHV
jgi:hypothetical protein